MKACSDTSRVLTCSHRPSCQARVKGWARRNKNKKRLLDEAAAAGGAYAIFERPKTETLVSNARRVREPSPQQPRRNIQYFRFAGKITPKPFGARAPLPPSAPSATAASRARAAVSVSPCYTVPRPSHAVHTVPHNAKYPTARASTCTAPMPHSTSISTRLWYCTLQLPLDVRQTSQPTPGQHEVEVYTNRPYTQQGGQGFRVVRMGETVTSPTNTPRPPHLTLTAARGGGVQPGLHQPHRWGGAS